MTCSTDTAGYFSDRLYTCTRTCPVLYCMYCSTDSLGLACRTLRTGRHSPWVAFHRSCSKCRRGETSDRPCSIDRRPSAGCMYCNTRSLRGASHMRHTGRDTLVYCSLDNSRSLTGFSYKLDSIGRNFLVPVYLGAYKSGRQSWLDSHSSPHFCCIPSCISSSSVRGPLLRWTLSLTLSS